MKKNVQAPIRVDFSTGLLNGDPRVERSTKTICQMSGVFLDEVERSHMDDDTVVYEVEYWKPVPDGTEGGLFWGNSTVYPGTVGDEYYMTRGHFHALRNRAEYYVTVHGAGMLLLMDEQRQSSVQEMVAGSTHYVPGGAAHRVVNTGDVPLTFLACWPSDAGYDYTTIDRDGFSIRIMLVNGCPKIIAQP